MATKKSTRTPGGASVPPTPPDAAKIADRLEDYMVRVQRAQAICSLARRAAEPISEECTGEMHHLAVEIESSLEAAYELLGEVGMRLSECAAELREAQS